MRAAGLVDDATPDRMRTHANRLRYLRLRRCATHGVTAAARGLKKAEREGGCERGRMYAADWMPTLWNVPVTERRYVITSARRGGRSERTCTEVLDTGDIRAHALLDDVFKELSVNLERDRAVDGGVGLSLGLPICMLDIPIPDEMRFLSRSWRGLHRLCRRSGTRGGGESVLWA